MDRSTRFVSLLSAAGLAAFLVLSVAAGAGAEDDLNAAAADLCKCQEGPNEKSAELMAAIQQAQSTGNFSEIMRIQGEMEAMMGEVEACYDGLSQKYQHIAADDEKKKKVSEIADRKCPNPAKRMMGR